MAVFVFVISLAVIIIALASTKRKNSSTNVEADIHQQKIAIRNMIIDNISRDFNVPYWNIWDASVHSVDGQYERLRRAVSESMVVLSYNDESIEAKIRSSSNNVYKTNFKGCSCPDFRMRHLPCKHMYMLRLWQNENQK